MKFIIAWVPMVFIAIANGALRQLGYGKFMSELSAHQLSCFTGIILFFIYTLLIFRRWPLNSTRQARIAGAVWLLLTVAFEFTFGHYIANKPWGMLFGDYNVLAGRLWSLVLIAITLMPYAAYRITSGKES
jgi:hypothetical protein